MPHHRRDDGRVVGWGPTVQELDHLATRFDEVRHIACLHDGPAPASFLPYRDDRVQLIPVPPTGGDRWRDKLSVLAATPGYVSAMLRELPHADMVHLRCPANVPMIAAALLPLVATPKARWIKYAGNWRPRHRDSVAFAFQRWFLAKPWHRGQVTINGIWPEQPGHVRTFYNPSLTDEEVASARQATERKELGRPMSLLFVGRLEPAKGPDVAIETLAQLGSRGIEAELALAGDGPDRAHYEQMARSLGVLPRVTFHGWLPRHALPALYARAHMLILPSTSEGWPKVLSEGMAYGAVPLASAVGAIPQYLEHFATGRALTAATPVDYASAIASYADHPELWLAESRRARDAASYFSYGYYLNAIDAMLAELGLR